MTRTKLYLPFLREKRRVNVSSYEELQNYVSDNIFEANSLQGEAIFQYLDSDEDWVTCGSESEWLEALIDLKDSRFTRDVLHLRVLYKKKPKRRECRKRCATKDLDQFPNFLASLLGLEIEKIEGKEQEKEPEKKEEIDQEVPLPVKEKVPLPVKEKVPLPVKEQVPLNRPVEEKVPLPVKEQVSLNRPVEEPELVQEVEEIEEVESPVEEVPIDEPIKEESSIEEEEQALEEPVSEEDYSESLALLQSMGFDDERLNEHILRLKKGELPKTVEALLKLTTSMHQA